MRVCYADNQYHALVGVVALIIATEWCEFRTPDFERVDQLLQNKVLFDGRNLFEQPMIKELGFPHESIGSMKYYISRKIKN